MPIHNYPHVRAQVRVVRALGNERRYVTTEVLTTKTMTEAELAEYHGVALPSMSRHLHILLKAGVLSSIRKGGGVYFRVSADFLSQWQQLKKILRKRKACK